MSKKLHYSFCFAFIICLNFQSNAQQNIFWRGGANGADSGNWIGDNGCSENGQNQSQWFYPGFTGNEARDQPNCSDGSTDRHILNIDNNQETNMTVDFDLSICQLIFQNTASTSRTISNSTITVANTNGSTPKIENFSNALHTINSNIVINFSTGEINPVNGDLTINGTINNDGNFIDVFGNNGRTLTLTGVISGSGGLAIKQNSTVVYGGDNTYTGSTVLEAGILRLQGNLADSDVTVQNGATLEIESDVTLKSLTVDTGGTVLVRPGQSLTITNNLNNSGNFTLESTSALYSSLIVNGTSTGAINYKRFVNQIGTTNNAVGNDLISLPLSFFPSDFGTLLAFGSPANSDIIATNPDNTLHAFGDYDNSNLVFNNYDAYPGPAPVGGTETLALGVGYRAATTSGANLTFTGEVLNTNLDVTITTPTSDMDSRWNLMGNPFPSYLNATKFLTDNSGPMEDLAEAIYAYNSNTYTGGAATTSNGYTIINLATIALLVGENFNIAPGQGFFVPAEPITGFSGTVTFNATTNDMRTTSGDDDYIEGRNNTTGVVFKLGLDSSSSENVTTFFFMDGASRGLDQGYDAGTFGISTLYSHLVEGNVGRDLALQALAHSDVSDVTIPLGINATQGEQITFDTAFSTLPETIDVYLDDIVTNTSTLLNTTDYVLTPTVNLDGTGRFFLRFKDSALSTAENTSKDYKIIADYSGNAIIVSGSFDSGAQVTVYDIQGRNVISSVLQTNTNTHSLNTSQLKTGIYIVEIKNDSINMTKKVVIR